MEVNIYVCMYVMPCSSLTGAYSLKESATLILTMKIQASEFSVTLTLTNVIKNNHNEHSNNLGCKDLKSYDVKMRTLTLI